MNQLNVSLWRDEAWAAILVNKSWQDIISFVARDTSPPLYYLILHFWINIFGNNEVSLRSLSLILILLASVFTGLIAQYIFKNRFTSLLVAIFTFFNPFLFQYAFEARMYALLVFTSTASTYFFLTKRWKWYVLFAVLALYTHHFSMFVIFWQFLWLFLITPKNLKVIFKAVLPFIWIGILYLPWLPVFYQQTTMVANKGFWISRPTFGNIPILLAEFVSGANKMSWQVWATSASLLLLVFRRWSLKDKFQWFLIGWVFVPVLMVFILSQIIQPIFYDRYFINIIPAFIILLFSGLRKNLSVIPLVVLIISVSLIDYRFFTQPSKEPFSSLVSYVNQSTMPGDYLINWNALSFFESKYYGLKAPVYTPDGPVPYYIGSALMGPEDQVSFLPTSSRLGVILNGNFNDLKIPGYSLQSQHQFGGLYFSWWEVNP